MNPYFAYGSNMWRAQMRDRCPDHQLIGSGVLKGYRWIISARGKITEDLRDWAVEKMQILIQILQPELDKTKKS